MDGFFGIAPFKIYNHGLVENKKTRMPLRSGIEFKREQGPPADARVDWNRAAVCTDVTPETDIGPIEKKREGVAKQMVAASSHLQGPVSFLSLKRTKRKAGTCTGKNPVNIESHMLKMIDGNNRQYIRKEILHSTSLPRCKPSQDAARVQEPLPASSRRQESINNTIEDPLRVSHLVLVC